MEIVTVDLVSLPRPLATLTRNFHAVPIRLSPPATLLTLLKPSKCGPDYSGDDMRQFVMKHVKHLLL